jgi:hypothetical protein
VSSTFGPDAQKKLVKDLVRDLNAMKSWCAAQMLQIKQLQSDRAALLEEVKGK